MTVDLANRGDRSAPGGTLSITNPFGGAPIVRSYPSLAAHGRTSVTVDVPVPAGTASGDHKLAATATGGSETFTAASVLHVTGPMTRVSLPYTDDVIASPDAPTAGDFGDGYAYAGQELPAAGPVTVGDVPYTFPSGAGSAANALVTAGQKVAVPDGAYSGLHVLASASYGPADITVTATYTDGTTRDLRLSAQDWMTGAGTTAAATSHRYHAGQLQDAVTKIYSQALPLDPGKHLASLTFGGSSQGGHTRADLFALTLEG